MLRATQLVDQADRNPAVAPILMKFHWVFTIFSFPPPPPPPPA
jgi:hypothetical protein